MKNTLFIISSSDFTEFGAWSIMRRVKLISFLWAVNHSRLYARKRKTFSSTSYRAGDESTDENPVSVFFQSP